MSTYSIVTDISPSIFRAYDIRGVVDKTLTPDIVYTIALAIGSEIQDRGEHKVVVGRDGRLSGPEYGAALIAGLRASGCDIVDVGQVPTPVLYFAVRDLEVPAGVMLTGSHNPSDYNGIKTLVGEVRLHGDAVKAIYERIQAKNLRTGAGTLETADVVSDYIERIVSGIQLGRPMKIVVDAGNGVTGGVIPTLYERLGCEVVPLFCDIDGHFPNHHPDPLVPENLADLIAAVKKYKADVGLAFDGDGDRLGVVTNQGNILFSDRQMMLFAKDVLSRNPGAGILFDVKSTRNLPKVIEGYGGKAYMWKTGHSLVRAKMLEVDALLAGELSGHIFFKERWYGFDDGMYAGARMLEILSNDVRDADEVARGLPESINTPEIKFPMAEDKKFPFMAQLIKESDFGDAKITTIDGIRVDFADGFGLIRPSNTSPFLILRFEADSEEGLERIKDAFRALILSIDSSLVLPF